MNDKNQKDPQLISLGEVLKILKAGTAKAGDIFLITGGFQIVVESPDVFKMLKGDAIAEFWHGKP